MHINKAEFIHINNFLKDKVAKTSISVHNAVIFWNFWGIEIGYNLDDISVPYHSWFTTEQKYKGHILSG